MRIRKMTALILCALTLTMAAGCGSKTTESSSKIDVDLTRMSSTMVYSEVNNILLNPQDYVDKTIKMEGEMAVYTNKDQSAYYYTVIVADATACCSQGLEFVLANGSTALSDYPESGTQVSVVGKGETYDEDGTEYFHLVQSELTVKE